MHSLKLFDKRLEEHLEEPQKYKMYEYNPKYTQSAVNPLFIKIYEKELKLYGESKSYNISMDENGNCTLVPNYRSLRGSLSTITPVDGKIYIFAIVLDERTNKLQLRIGEGSHYLIANQATQVVAAGTLCFMDRKIISICNDSGAYHVDFATLPEEKQAKYVASLKRALEKVNLPADKLVLFEKEPPKACLPSG
ncbi:hypothetical protein [Legionella micdadei]|uniref:Uncharacterized protein n=1 Tax=Legionella micdadei TaxID=451 RepID=A0A098GAW6_LEGMI|nr:hypothetical protein [Legionella micdadei]ARG96371.1 hypothetical protein B6N58_00985 [Legionella micdadei]ARG99120.1 hypothetical protein B6V88_00975 [Legionella micdadei]KTD29545.1 hypothetical protein Lmic_0617 [Legionella micdadei]NSL18058.1 hypothetical protein [Legionella micdadei]CEG59573.1 protein of unknown function [Legionella micdadei]